MGNVVFRRCNLPGYLSKDVKQVRVCFPSLLFFNSSPEKAISLIASSPKFFLN